MTTFLWILHVQILYILVYFSNTHHCISVKNTQLLYLEMGPEFLLRFRFFPCLCKFIPNAVCHKPLLRMKMIKCLNYISEWGVSLDHNSTEIPALTGTWPLPTCHRVWTRNQVESDRVGRGRGVGGPGSTVRVELVQAVGGGGQPVVPLVHQTVPYAAPRQHARRGSGGRHQPAALLPQAAAMVTVTGVL